MKKLILLSLLILSNSQIFLCQGVYGIDVSNWQGNVDWEEVASDGYTFAWVKATEGMTYMDPMFFNNMENGINANIVMGAYHFARPDNNSPQEDAANFLSVAENYIGNGFLPPVLDLENPYSGGQAILLTEIFTSQELTAWVSEWMESVESQSGVTPYIYINGNYANYLDPSLITYGLWFAQPDESTNPPSNIGSWEDWGFKQYSWWGSINGLVGDVDLNIFNGSLGEFNELIGINTAEMNQTALDNIRVYPNPVERYLYLEGSIADNLNFSLYDINGIIHPVSRFNETIDLSQLNCGLYFLRFESSESLPITFKIVKK